MKANYLGAVSNSRAYLILEQKITDAFDIHDDQMDEELSLGGIAVMNVYNVEYVYIQISKQQQVYIAPIRKLDVNSVRLLWLNYIYMKRKHNKQKQTTNY